MVASVLLSMVAFSTILLLVKIIQRPMIILYFWESISKFPLPDSGVSSIVYVHSPKKDI